MSEKGWVSIHRKIADNSIWTCEPFTRGQAWIDLVILANHKPGYVYVRGNKITVDRGQLGWSIDKLSKRWKWSKGRVKRFLVDLQKESQIDLLKTPVITVISITKYNDYQKNEQQTGLQTDTQTGSQTDHRQVANNNDNNNNKKNPSVFSNFLKAFGTDKKHIVRKFTLNQKKSVVWHLLEPLGYTKQEAATYWETIHDRNYVNPDGDPYTMEMIYKEVKYYHSRGWIKRESKDD